jgi:hypothetical protein
MDNKKDNTLNYNQESPADSIIEVLKIIQKDFQDEALKAGLYSEEDVQKLIEENK